MQRQNCTLRKSSYFKFSTSDFTTKLWPILWYIMSVTDSHYGDVIISTMASQITSLTIVYSTIYLGADQRKHQSSASMAFVRGIHWWPVNSLHKWPVTLKMFPFDDVIMCNKFFKNVWDSQAVKGQFLYSDRVVFHEIGIKMSRQGVLMMMPPMSYMWGPHHTKHSSTIHWQAMFCTPQGHVLQLWHDPVTRFLANGSTAFIESCTAIG